MAIVEPQDTCLPGRDAAGDVRGTAVSVRRWTASTVGVAASRIATGLLLAVYYADHARFTSKVFSTSGLAHGLLPLPDTVFAPASAAVLRLGTLGLQVWFAFGAVLGVLLALGIAPRVCAALLLVLSTATYETMRPAVMLDDYFAQAAAFWLVLLPTTRSRRVLGPPREHPQKATLANGWTAVACLAFVFAFFLQYSLESPALPPLARLGFFAAAACAAAPLGAWRALGTLPAVIALWHVGQRPGALFACGLTITICGVALARLAEEKPDGSSRRPASPLGLEVAVGFFVVVLFSLNALAMNFNFPSIVQSTRTILADTGLAWQPAAATPETPRAALDVAFAAEGSSDPQAENLASEDPRLQNLLGLLEVSSSATEPVRSTLIQRLVARHCRDLTAEDAAMPGQMTLRGGGRASRPLVWFQCRKGNGDEAVIVPLKTN